MATLTVELQGTPPNPNRSRSYGHWAQRARADGQWKSDAHLAAVDARNRSGLTGFPWPRVALRIEFIVPTQQRRDPDNLVASIKPALDGLVSGGVIADDSSRAIEQFGPIVITYARGQRAVRFTVEQLT